MELSAHQVSPSAGSDVTTEIFYTKPAQPGDEPLAVYATTHEKAGARSNWEELQVSPPRSHSCLPLLLSVRICFFLSFPSCWRPASVDPKQAAQLSTLPQVEVKVQDIRALDEKPQLSTHGFELVPFEHPELEQLDWNDKAQVCGCAVLAAGS